MSWKTHSRTRLTRSALTGAGAAASLLAAGGAFAQAIEVESLAPVDPFGVGILSQSEGGLPESLWRGSSAGLAREALTRAPDSSTSPAVNGLLRSVLLSGGDAPEGADEEDGTELATLRLAALVDAGMAAEAARLAGRTPDIASRPDLAQVQARAELLSGDLARACRTADGLREGRDGVFWLRLRAVCLAAAGETARSDLTAQLARQDGRSEQFERAYSLAILGDAPEEEVQTADPLVFASAVSAGSIITLPANAPRAMRVTPLPGATPEMLAADLGHAAGLGLADPEAVARAYQNVEPPELDDGESLLEAAMDAEPGTREAMLYMVATDPGWPDDVRADALAEALQAAEGVGGFIAASRALTEALRRMPVTDGSPHGLLFAESAAAAGESALARRWLEAAQTEPRPADPVLDSDGAPVDLGASEPWDEPDPISVEEVEALIALFEESSGSAAARLEADGPDTVRMMDAVVLDAMAGQPAPAVRLALLRGEGDEGERTDGPMLAAMEASAAADASGETALLAAAAMAAGPGALAPADLSRVLRAMRAAGLEAQAREAGLEAMLAARR